MLTTPRPIRLKGRSYLALTLKPDLPIEDWLMRLDDLAARSPGFFLRRPVVLDVEELDIDRTQLRALSTQLAARNVRVLGIEGARPSALAPDLPPAMSGGRDSGETVEESTAPASGRSVVVERIVETQPRKASSSLILDENVRSGQSIIHLDGDVTVMGNIASGAEVIAGGSIHVYGTLRGRALAGAMGNGEARIFCRRLEAELVSIDGLYKTADDLGPDIRGHAVQFWLNGETFNVGSLA
ncbi:putative septum site-determining protein MinC [Azorhizobium oxalatiphilum]|uniref:Probable septum site-determining protein MinC n=1 Tax=Azorhizobium oxalatiphilum TaxID=980631 RepID=A0A917FKQ7_9HYPH|nr:putative septum site-determining protein MinC [Azorhizobium oxalatiphilum]